MKKLGLFASLILAFGLMVGCNSNSSSSKCCSTSGTCCKAAKCCSTSGKCCKSAKQCAPGCTKSCCAKS